MKILQFSDPHTHNWTYGAKIVDGWNSRLLVIRDFYRHIVKVCQEENIDAVVCLGDVFHEHGKTTADVNQVAFEGFSAIRRVVKRLFILVGNHDFQNKSGTINSLCFLKGGGIDVVFPELQAGDLGFISFTHDKEQFKQSFSRMVDSCNIVFVHQGITGVTLGNGFELPNEYLDPKMVPEEWFKRMVFSGHIHKHQQVTPNLVVVGSPVQHVKSDSGDDRGYVILDTNSQQWDFRPYHDAPKFVHLTIDKDDPDEARGNYVLLHGDDFAELEGAKEMLLKESGALSVEIIPPIQAVPEYGTIRAPLSLEELVEAFEKERQIEKDLSEIGKQLRSGKFFGPTKYKN